MLEEVVDLPMPPFPYIAMFLVFVTIATSRWACLRGQQRKTSPSTIDKEDYEFPSFLSFIQIMEDFADEIGDLSLALWSSCFAL